MNNTITIHSRKLAIYLQCKGFILHGIAPSLKNNYKVFIFTDSDRLQESMHTYKHDKEFHEVFNKMAV